jgi:hypothetical protein
MRLRALLVPNFLFNIYCILGQNAKKTVLRSLSRKEPHNSCVPRARTQYGFASNGSGSEYRTWVLADVEKLPNVKHFISHSRQIYNELNHIPHGRLGAGVGATRIA